jgi:hypothetical protein
VEAVGRRVRDSFGRMCRKCIRISGCLDFVPVRVWLCGGIFSGAYDG